MTCVTYKSGVAFRFVILKAVKVKLIGSEFLLLNFWKIHSICRLLDPRTLVQYSHAMIRWPL